MISRTWIFEIALAVALLDVPVAFAQPDAKPGKQPDAQPEAKSDVKSGTQEDAKPAAESDAQPEAQPEAQEEKGEDEEQAYLDIIKQAVYETDMGNWKEARALFRQAHELQPNARTYRGLGMVAFNMRDYVQAIRDLRSALGDERRELTESQRAHVQDLLHRAHQFVGQYRLQPDPDSATVAVDGNPVVYEKDGAVLINLGEHSLRVTAEGYRELARTLKVEGGEDRVLKLVLQPESAKIAGRSEPETGGGTEPVDQEPGGRLWTWVALGGAVAAGAAGVTFGLIGDAKYSELEDECGELGCLRDEADTSPVETNYTLANVFYGVSGACLVGAVVLFFVEGNEEEAPGQEAGGLSVGLGTVSLKARF
jgi:hypothetical protein